MRSAVVPGGRCEAADGPESLGRRGGQLRAAAALENDLFSTKLWPSSPSPADAPVAPSRCQLAMALLAQTAAPEPLRCSSPSQTCHAPGMAAVRAAVHLTVCTLYGVPRLALICLRSSLCSCPDQPEVCHSSHSSHSSALRPNSEIAYLTFWIAIGAPNELYQTLSSVYRTLVRTQQQDR